MKAERAKVTVRGLIQGIGFRPFVYRLATKLKLNGWVSNSAQGLFIEVEGGREALQSFLFRLEREKPPRAVIQSLEFSFLDAAGYRQFDIRESDQSGLKSVLILPDIAICDDCLGEIFDPGNRRFRYPFTNCTNCGPRFTIIESLPYDRPRTSMKRFAMCPACEREYGDPSDRRFHAQPNACPICGPKLELWNAKGDAVGEKEAALLYAINVIREGQILALKGIGGFQLIVDARNADAVQRLRMRKGREEKPFALMFPSFDQVKRHCHVSQLEARLLLAPEAPIVLLRRKASKPLLAPVVAPGNPHLGVMLPYSPLHHLLMRDLGIPVVATSGNLTDEPICIDEREALKRLEGVADYFLIHDRPIVRHLDDSVARVVCGREMVLRRARGYAPLPVHVKNALPCVLAVGAHLKNSVALSVGREIFVSQHIGDLETNEAFSAFRRTAADLPRLYEAQPRSSPATCIPITSRQNMHWECHRLRTKSNIILLMSWLAWLTTNWRAQCLESPGMAPVMVRMARSGAENFSCHDDESFQRVAHFRQFRLPGGDAAVKEPRRTALGVLYEIWGDTIISDRHLRADCQFLRRRIRRPSQDALERNQFPFYFQRRQIVRCGGLDSRISTKSHL